MDLTVDSPLPDQNGPILDALEAAGRYIEDLGPPHHRFAGALSMSTAEFSASDVNHSRR